jgi:hypothetical protein
MDAFSVTTGCENTNNWRETDTNRQFLRNNLLSFFRCYGDINIHNNLIQFQFNWWVKSLVADDKNTTIHIQNKDTRGKVRINAKLRRVRVNIVTVEKQ